jgi:hypothetical protein
MVVASVVRRTMTLLTLVVFGIVLILPGHTLPLAAQTGNDTTVFLPMLAVNTEASVPPSSLWPAGEWYNGNNHHLYPSTITATANITDALYIADENPNLSWAAPGGASVTADLNWPDPSGSVTLNLRKLRITWPAAVGYRFAVDVSQDQVEWTRVLSATSQAVRPTFDEFTFSGAPGRYVRITNLGQRQIVISEVEFWGTVEQGDALIHPGHTINAAQIQIIRDRVAEGRNPWKAAFERQMNSTATSGPFNRSLASRNYQPSAKAVLDIGIDGADNTDDGVNDHVVFVEQDGAAAYVQAVAYIVTEDPVYAENVLRILRDWSNVLTTLRGANAALEAGWGISSMTRAAELIKHTYPAWDSAVERSFNTMVDTLMMPTIEPKITGANRFFSMNEARLTTAIFRDDRYQMNRALELYRRYFATFVQANGIHGETCRDMQHAQFALGGMAQIAEIAWKQGVDLYSYLDNRLQATIEYHANILYGGTPSPDPGCQLTNIGGSAFVGKPQGVNTFGYEIAYNHYVNRKGLTMPATRLLIEYGRPDGYQFHWGLATLTHADIQDPR